MKTQKKYESTKGAASYSQSLCECRSLQCELKFHVDEFEFDSSVPISAHSNKMQPLDLVMQIPAMSGLSLLLCHF